MRRRTRRAIHAGGRTEYLVDILGINAIRDQRPFHRHFRRLAQAALAREFLQIEEVVDGGRGRLELAGVIRVDRGPDHARDRAIADLQALLEQPYVDGISPELLRLDPDWDDLRRDARFQALLTSK